MVDVLNFVLEHAESATRWSIPCRLHVGMEVMERQKEEIANFLYRQLEYTGTCLMDEAAIVAWFSKLAGIGGNVKVYMEGNCVCVRSGDSVYVAQLYLYGGNLRRNPIVVDGRNFTASRMPRLY